MIVDFQANPKQSEFLNAVLMAASGKSPIRQIIMGGGIRSGKSFAMLGACCILAVAYPGSRTVIYRKDFPSLVDTTIVSFDKIIAGSSSWKCNRSPSNFYYEHIKTGSRIYMFGENISIDPQLNSILGLELNFVVLEQCEELSETLYQKIQSRMGSYILDKMPKPLMLLTTNPTQNWVKETFYMPWRSGTLPEHKMFISANPSDNKFVTEDQLAIFNTLDERTKRQYVEGDWTDLRSKDDLFAYSFNRDKHIAKDPDDPKWNGDKNHYLYLSFDFNRNPICCVVIQHIEGQIRVLEQIKLSNSDIYKLCDYIRVKYDGFLKFITGDASGKNSQALVRDSLNYYRIIQSELRVPAEVFNIPSVNPRLEDNQVLVNSMLERYNIQIHPEKGKALIWDLENVRCLANGSIIKGDRNDPAQQSDALDCLRYYFNTYHKNYIRLKEIS